MITITKAIRKNDQDVIGNTYRVESLREAGISARVQKQFVGGVEFGNIISMPCYSDPIDLASLNYSFDTPTSMVC